MSKSERRKELEGKVKESRVTSVKEEIVETHVPRVKVSDTTLSAEAEEKVRVELEKSAAELRDEARKLLAEAEAKDREEIKRKEREEAEKRARIEREEAERKAKEELERAKSQRKVYFTHNADGSIDFDHPFMSANEAKFYDPEYAVVPSLVENGHYVRPLTKEEASRH